MNVKHAIPSAMSGFITELLTSAVYCYFLFSVYKDREATYTNAQDACAEYTLNIV